MFDAQITLFVSETQLKLAVSLLLEWLRQLHSSQLAVAAARIDMDAACCSVA